MVNRLPKNQLIGSSPHDTMHSGIELICRCIYIGECGSKSH